jgi:hypothetical protein
MKTKLIIIGIAAAASIWLGRVVWRAHYDLVTLQVRNTPLAEVIRQIERQTREKVRADKKLDAKVTLDVKNLPLPRVLDLLSEQAGARWGKTYAVYESDSAVRRLESVLLGSSKLDDAGWTNLAPHFATLELPGLASSQSAVGDGSSASSAAAANRSPNPPARRTGQRKMMVSQYGTPGAGPNTGPSGSGGGFKRKMKDGSTVEEHWEGPFGTTGPTAPPGYTGPRTFTPGGGGGSRRMTADGRIIEERFESSGPSGGMTMRTGPGGTTISPFGSSPSIAQQVTRTAPDGTTTTNTIQSGGESPSPMSAVSGPGRPMTPTSNGDRGIRITSTSSDGAVEDEWSSERLVMEKRLGYRLGGSGPTQATRESASQTAGKVRGKFVTYYALEKPPLGGATMIPSSFQQSFRPGGTNNRFANGDIGGIIEAEQRQRNLRELNNTPEQQVQRARQREESKRSGH